MEEMKVFLNGLKNHRLYPLFALAYATGARKGEILALNWSDIDLDTGKISISKNRIQSGKETYDQPNTKGGEGRRSVSIDPETISILMAHKRAQLQERLLVGSEWTDSGYVFVTEWGKPINYGTPTQLFAKTVKSLGLRDQHFTMLATFMLLSYSLQVLPFM